MFWYCVATKTFWSQCYSIMRCSILKPIHANWLVEMYNFFASTEGRGYILKGWEKAGIKSVVSGTQILPPLDPFQDIYTS